MYYHCFNDNYPIDQEGISQLNLVKLGASNNDKIKI